VHTLVLNGGSSSIKFSLFESIPNADPKLVLDGELSGIGTPSPTLKLGSSDARIIEAKDPSAAIRAVFEAISQPGIPPIDAVGYRVVHPGPKLDDHQRITPEVLADLEAAAAFAPLHDPEAVQLIREGQQHLPNIPHFACFDTVFHRTMPPEASTYPLPPEYAAQGVHRYGFHGLSCESIVRQLHPVPARMAIAHLGSGCSVTTLRDGRSIDNTMGFTPTGGVVMGTRPGDLDPGLIFYLLRQHSGDKAFSLTAIEAMLNHHSGMVALSGQPNDMKAVRKAATAGDPNAQLALKIFTRTITKALAAACWTLGGLDAIVFAGGIGEHDAASRAEILAGLEQQGIAVNSALNESHSSGQRAIGASDSHTALFIVPAQEDLMIALHVERMENMTRTPNLAS